MTQRRRGGHQYGDAVVSSGARQLGADRAGSAATAADLVLPAFRREFTPTWLTATAILSGHRPPDGDRPLRVLDLQCRSGINAAVIAAAHPQADIVACDDEPANVERADRLATEARLGNLTVLETGSSNASAALGPVDIALLDDIVSTTDDTGRAGLAALVAGCVRAGGLIVVVYRTRVAWAEVVPLRSLVRLLGPLRDRVSARQVGVVVHMLERLRSGGARYVVDRPAVSALVEHVASLHRDQVADVLMTEHLEPLALVDVAEWLAPTGAVFVGSGRLGDRDGAYGDAPLIELLRDTHDVYLREALDDLAFRPSYRVDVFRRGAAVLPTEARRSLLMDLELVGLGSPERCDDDDDDSSGVIDDAVSRLCKGPARVGDLIEDGSVDAAHADRLVRRLLDRGRAHSRSTGWGAADAHASCSALNRCLAAMDEPTDATLLAAPCIGSAIPVTTEEREVLAARSPTELSSERLPRAELLAHLGITTPQR
jgi:hypothetical protein